MTREDINDIIQTICPNDDDFEKPIISPAYLKKELEALALEQESNTQEILKLIKDCDETSATKCFTCINDIKERYFNDSKRISKSDKSII